MIPPLHAALLILIIFLKTIQKIESVEFNTGDENGDKARIFKRSLMNHIKAMQPGDLSLIPGIFSLSLSISMNGTPRTFSFFEI